MAIEPLFGSLIYIGAHDFTGDANKGSLTGESVVLPRTTFASGGHEEVRGGLKKWDSNLDGYWESGADAVDAEAFTALGVPDQVLSLTPTGAQGGPCYFGQASKLKYNLFGGVGELAPFTLGLGGSNTVGLVRGRLAVAKATVTTTGAKGVALQLGAVAADEYVYAAVHLFGTAGTSITLKVQSDNASNFPSPTDVATIGPLTAAGGTWMTRVAGAITDDYFRINVSAITGTWSMAAAIGIA